MYKLFYKFKMRRKKLKIPALILGAAIAMGFASCKIDSEDDVSKLLLLISSSGKTVTHSVTFVSNGGTAVDSQTVIHGNKAEKPENPTKTAIGTEKYAFENWYVSEDGGTTLSDTAFDFDTPIEKDITLYANWTVTKLYSVSIATDIKHGAVEASKTSGITEGETITLTVRIDDGYKSVRKLLESPLHCSAGLFLWVYTCLSLWCFSFHKKLSTAMETIVK